MYIIFIRKSWISSPSKNSLFLITRLNHGWIWYCQNLRQNNSQICKFWNQQLYFQKLCLWDDQNSSESALLAETRPVTSIGCWGTQDPNQAARGLCFKFTLSASLRQADVKSVRTWSAAHDLQMFFCLLQKNFDLRFVHSDRKIA